jgi:hypothetical protein
MNFKARLLSTIAASVAAWFGRRGPTPSRRRHKRAAIQKPHDPLHNCRAARILHRLNTPRLGDPKPGTKPGRRWARKNRALTGAGNPKRKHTPLAWRRRAVEAQLERQKRQLEKLTA